ncbi:nitrous oxide reductase family maturation protein NosD [Streptomyces sp. NRRL S-87]|uniref:right-handed parallel beta-helix repeat-containing protein n=1 Tax=Streptomyces sp. NRRL S-87 TaxID=1463920 RepID=UPI0004C26805|nr:right-handed parallel beta-helix repeat-containing protein [Streptomyces sp. NRRL S-87]
MKSRHILSLACTAAACGSLLGAAPPSTGPLVHVVRPGESIQRAVDTARPGDTVLLVGGTYRESVRVTTSGLTLRGLGPRTVLEPAVPPAAVPPASPPAATAAARAADSCALAGNGICVEGADGRPVSRTTITGLVLSGFAKNGLWASGTDRLTVRGVTARNNGQWGIAQEHSTRGVFVGNVATGNGDAGLFLANTVKTEGGATDTGGALVARNRLQGNRIGVTVRRLRNLTVERNDITGNCAGVFVVGDETPPRAGDLTVRANRVVANNKYCPKTARLPFLQGVGVVLTGAEDTQVTGNLITDNVGTSPLSGGVVLLKSFVGVTNERNRITGNTLRSNAPADLVDTDAGRDNVFRDNACAASRPAGLC